MKRVPCPSVLATSMRPWSASTAARTASSPTPRPEVSVTSVRVLKPGRKMRSRIWLSFIRASSSAGATPAGLGHLAHMLHVDAAPVIAGLEEEEVALLLDAQGERALMVLARALALGGHSPGRGPPRCAAGAPARPSSFSSSRRSSDTSAPTTESRASLPSWRDRSRTMRCSGSRMVRTGRVVMALRPSSSASTMSAVSSPSERIARPHARQQRARLGRLGQQPLHGQQRPPRAPDPGSAPPCAGGPRAGAPPRASAPSPAASPRASPSPRSPRLSSAEDRRRAGHGGSGAARRGAATRA